MKKLIKIVKLKNKSAGFTLAEMLVVIAIIIIISVLTVPSYNNFRRASQLRQAAQDVRQAIVDAQNMALAPKEIPGLGTPKSYVLNFQNPIAGRNQFTLYRDMNDDKIGDEVINTYILTEQNVVFDSISPAATQNIAFSTPRAVIFVNGAESTATIDIRLKLNAGTDVVSVKLNAASGQTSID